MVAVLDPCDAAALQQMGSITSAGRMELDFRSILPLKSGVDGINRNRMYLDSWQDAVRPK